MTNMPFARVAVKGNFWRRSVRGIDSRVGFSRSFVHTTEATIIKMDVDTKTASVMRKEMKVPLIGILSKSL